MYEKENVEKEQNTVGLFFFYDLFLLSLFFFFFCRRRRRRPWCRVIWRGQLIFVVL